MAFIGGPELSVGQRCLFFLATVSNSVGVMVGDLQLVEAWPVGADDIVETRQEGPIALSELIKTIERTPLSDGS